MKNIEGKGEGSGPTILKPRARPESGLLIPIIGTAPMIVNRFPEKAKQQMLEKQQKRAKVGTVERDPKAEAVESEHVMSDGRVGFPAVGFKKAIVSASRLDAGLKMTELRQAISIFGEATTYTNTAFEGAIGRDILVPLIVPKSARAIREDMVRISGGTSMLRYRMEYGQWAAVLHVNYASGFLSEEQLATLIEQAGSSVGVGEWRPERNGVYGTFRMADMAEVEALKKLK